MNQLPQKTGSEVTTTRTASDTRAAQLPKSNLQEPKGGKGKQFSSRSEMGSSPQTSFVKTALNSLMNRINDTSIQNQDHHNNSTVGNISKLNETTS